jgi:hypothetical protein
LTLAAWSTASVVAGDGKTSDHAGREAARARGAKMKVAAPVETPDVIAVRIRHDMCPFCRGFDPQFPRIVRRFADASVLFVTLDLSSEASQRQAALMVAALGLERVWTGDMSRMGTITFVDGLSKNMISEVYMVDAATVTSSLHGAIAASTRESR